MKSHAACCFSGVLFMMARFVPEKSDLTGLPGAVGIGAIPSSNAPLTALAMNGSPAMVVGGDIATFLAPRSFCQSKPLLTYAVLDLMLLTSKVSAAIPSGPLKVAFLKSALITSPPRPQTTGMKESGEGWIA